MVAIDVALGFGFESFHLANLLNSQLMRNNEFSDTLDIV